jgi:hypothetical protein
VPYIYHSKEADALTVYFEGDADYSKRLNDHITLYLSIDTDEIVGCRIKGVKGIIEDLPNFIRVNHGSVELSLLFWAFRGGADQEESEKINDLARLGTERKMTLDPVA